MNTLRIGVALVLVFTSALRDVTSQTPTNAYASALEARLFTDSSLLFDPRNALPLLLASDPAMTTERQHTIQRHFRAFCDELESRRVRYRTEVQYLYYVFHRVHLEFLHRYDIEQPFHTIFTDRTYNCVSGTALYELVLRRLGYSTKIRETHNHLYLVVELHGTNILIECTDPANGFIVGQKEIDKREAGYAEGQGSFVSSDRISLLNLCGLQYFNEALLRFEAGDYEASLHALAKGATLYTQSVKIYSLRRKVVRSQQYQSAAVADKTVRVRKGIFAR